MVELGCWGIPEVRNCGIQYLHLLKREQRPRLSQQHTDKKIVLFIDHHNSRHTQDQEGREQRAKVQAKY